MIRTLHVIRGGLNYNIELCWEGVPSVSLALTKQGSQAFWGTTPSSGKT